MSLLSKKANTSARKGNFHAHQISRAPALASRRHAERQLRVPKNSFVIGVLRRTATRANVDEAYRWWRTSPHDFSPLSSSARKKRLRFERAVLESFSILNGACRRVRGVGARLFSRVVYREEEAHEATRSRRVGWKYMGRIAPIESPARGSRRRPHAVQHRRCAR